MLKFLLLFFLVFFPSNLNADVKEKIIQNLKHTKNLDFKFEPMLKYNMPGLEVSPLNSNASTILFVFGSFLSYYCIAFYTIFFEPIEVVWDIKKLSIYGSLSVLVGDHMHLRILHSNHSNPKFAFRSIS